MRPLLCLSVLLILGACTPSASPPGWSGSAPSPRARPAVSGPVAPARPSLDAADLARRVHGATNEARRRQGVAELAWDGRLVPVAAGHSRDMAQRGFFDHVTPDGLTPNDRAGREGVDCRAALGAGRERVGVLENLYKTSRWTSWTERTVGGRTTRDYAWQTAGEITRAVVDGWLESPGHRRNLLDPTARRAAVAVAFARDDAIYVTQVLC